MFGARLTVNYYVKRPGKKLRKFAIYKRVVCHDGKTQNTTIKNKDVDGVNLQYARNNISLENAEKKIQAIKARLSGETPLIFNADNNKTVEQFLTAYFRSKPFLVSRESAANKFYRAIRCLGSASIIACTYDEVLDAVMRLETNSQQRESAHKLNSILKWLGRDVRIPIAPKDQNEVSYLTEAELEKLLTALKPDMVAAATLSFYSGLRVSELLALTPSCLLENNIIKVDWQLDKGKKRAPKNRKKRKAYLHPKGLNAFKSWTSRESTDLNRLVINKRFKSTCRRVLRRNDLSWHSLRHSYAIYLLGTGAPLNLVAQSLGNSAKVCEEYYAGFILSDVGIETLHKIMMTD